MMNDENFQKVLENTLRLEKFVDDMSVEVESIRQAQLQIMKKELAHEIVSLRAQVERRLKFLQYLQKSNNKLFISVPKSDETRAIDLIVDRYTQEQNIIDTYRTTFKRLMRLLPLYDIYPCSGIGRSEAEADTKNVQEKRTDSIQEKKTKQCNTEEDTLAVDPIFLVDMRVGQIVHVKMFREGSEYFVVEINCGKERPQSIVVEMNNSNAAKVMENMMVVVIRNSPPVNFYGTISEGRILCGRNGNSVRLFLPPEGCVPGDVVQCISHIRVPIPLPTTTEKAIEKFTSEFSIHKKNIACYKGCALYVGGKGHISAQNPLTIFKEAGMNVVEESKTLEN